jgi:hypothetical protein
MEKNLLITQDFQVSIMEKESNIIINLNSAFQTIYFVALENINKMTQKHIVIT